jgi:hypothetical protein
MFVYVIVNSATLKIYVGKTTTGNLDLYLKRKIRDAQKGKYRGRSYLFASMQKHPSTVWSIHPLLAGETNEEICEHEKVLIKMLGTQNPEVGYNICRGGEGYTGSMSEEVKAKLKEVGNPVFLRSPEQEALRKAAVEKARQEQGGTFLSAESVDKIKAARAEQDETARIEGCRKYAEEHPEEMSTRMSRETHVLGGKAGSREDKQRAGRIAAKSLPKAIHVRWHVNRGQTNSECSFCRLAIS